jgi:putative ABC transport system permease protein
MSDQLDAVRLRTSDVLRVGSSGLRARPGRVVLSAIGIAIGIAAMISVVGISSSSRAELDRQLSTLGTNLLTVTPGNTIGGVTASLPKASVSMIRRIGPVTEVAAAGLLSDAVYRTDLVPSAESGGISVIAAQLNLLRTVSATVAQGSWLNGATEHFLTVVLGADTAKALGVATARSGMQVWLGGRWFTVVGILAPAPLAPELDAAALVGWPIAESALGFNGHPTTIYTRSHDADVESVASVLAATANPSAPSEVKVSRPSDALAARQVADQSFTSLLLALGAVALLVGGLGVANTMVISVLERRAEIGLRRSLGATRGHIRSQFLSESLLLAALGGGIGVLLGILATTLYSTLQHEPTVVPVWATFGGFLVTLVTGAVAGLYPAIRASRLSPTEALSTP